MNVRIWTSLMLVAAAAALFLGLLEYTHSSIASGGDYAEERSRPDDPIIMTLWEWSDGACILGEPCRHPAHGYFEGLYARAGVPTLLAILGGLLTAPLLFVLAITNVFRRRWIFALALWAGAFVFFFALTIHQPKLVEYKRDAKHSEVAFDFATQSPFEPPLLTTRTRAVGECYSPGCRRDKRVEGIYRRPAVPRLVALIGGLVVPALLLLSGLLLAITSLIGKMRRR
jgi:hypothetical protein